eukprot:5566525-Alexandrium_andersonii.AAC.1
MKKRTWMLGARCRTAGSRLARKPSDARRCGRRRARTGASGAPWPPRCGPRPRASGTPSGAAHR